VAARAPIGGTNDPVNADGRCAEGCFTLSEAYIADGPMQPNTAYRVNLASTNNEHWPSRASSPSPPAQAAEPPTNRNWRRALTGYRFSVDDAVGLANAI
jgi:hypothetical protein